MTAPPEVLGDLTDRIRSAGAALVCVDGPAGSGKTTLAAQLADALEAPVVHMDDLYEGWAAGPDGGADRLRDWVLTPLAAGRPARYRRYDWARGEWAEWHELPPSVAGPDGARGSGYRARGSGHRASAPGHGARPPRPLVVEGCGSAARQVDAFPGGVFIVWVEAGDAERLRRGLERDGEAALDHWLRWMKTEADHYAREHTRARAHVRLDGFGALVE